MHENKDILTLSIYMVCFDSTAFLVNFLIQTKNRIKNFLRMIEDYHLIMKYYLIFFSEMPKRFQLKSKFETFYLIPKWDMQHLLDLI